MNATPILLTGAHRSGSTWAGRMLALAPELTYIHEPFNLQDYPDSPIRHWFEYVSFQDEAERQMLFRKYLSSFLSRWGARYWQPRPEQALPMTPRYWAGTLRKKLAGRALMKDPLALFSAEWIAEQFQAQVVITVRHPAAFVASLKVKDWTFDFQHWGQQTRLITDQLEVYRSQIETYAQHPPDLIDQGILLWNGIYGTVKEYQKIHPDWLVITHEALSLAPVEQFQSLYAQLGLRFSSQIERQILESSEGSNTGYLKRDSKANMNSWRERLNDSEIERIYQGTAPLLSYFYPDTYGG